jgi:uncharacterized membrane protein
MKPERLCAFTDGVIAIVITIMVLELPLPEAPGMRALRPILPLFGVYALSFTKVGIYWSNHHHLLCAARRVNGRVLLANLFQLFWLSLIPYVMRWIGEAGLTRDTVLAFGAVMLMSALGFAFLRSALILANGPDSAVARATSSGYKGTITLGAYLLALPVAFLSPGAALTIYAIVALMWLIPDKRFESLED